MIHSNSRSILAVLAALILWVEPAAANPPLPLPHPDAVCDPQDATKCVTPLRKGEPAPYEGQLLSPRKAVAIWRGVDDCQTHLDLSLEQQRAIEGMRHQYWTDRLKLHEKHWQVKIDLLQRELDTALKAQKQPFWEKPWVVGIGATLLTTVMYYVSVQTVKAIGRP